MNIKCEKCQTIFKLSDKNINNTNVKFKCSRCGHIFRVEALNHIENRKKTDTRGITYKDVIAAGRKKKFPGPPPVFSIFQDVDCPLYNTGDEFLLSETFMGPHGKPPCLILIKDLMTILRHRANLRPTQLAQEVNHIYECSGCTGSIRFGYKTSLINREDNYLESVSRLLSGFEIFEGLGADHIKSIVAYLRLDKFSRGEYILRKGDPGRSLFILISGKVGVLDDDGMVIANMTRGDVFGEMSLLSGDPVGASIRAVESAAVLRINGEDFHETLHKFPELQRSFTRLLVRRVAEINMARSKEFASSISGKLSEIPPSDLFQTFNINQKTGVLTMKLPREAAAKVAFRDGKLVKVRLSEVDSELEGEEAFFELLKIRKGRFQYLPGLSPQEMKASEIGDFMYLLIEGLRRIDEDDRQFLRTVIPTLV